MQRFDYKHMITIQPHALSGVGIPQKDTGKNTSADRLASSAIIAMHANRRMVNEKTSTPTNTAIGQRTPSRTIREGA